MQINHGMQEICDLVIETAARVKQEEVGTPGSHQKPENDEEGKVTSP